MISSIVKNLLLHWIPRVLTIGVVAFITIYTLFTFSNTLFAFQDIAGFFIYFIPTFLMLLFLKIAWKHEVTGGILFLLLASILLLVYKVQIGIAVFLILLFISILFFVDNYNIKHHMN